MTVRTIVAALAAIALVGCSGSDDAPDLVPDSPPDTRLSDEELLDGAFEKNDGVSEPGDAPDSTTETGDEPSPDDTTTTTDAQNGDDSDTTGGADSGDSTATSGSAATGEGSSTTDGGATDGTTGEIEALTGVITIGADKYVFPIDGCTVVDEETSVFGESTLNGIPFVVDVTSFVFDLGEDGTETTLDISVEIDPDGDGDQPYFYAAGVQPAPPSAEFNIDFSVTASRITASGPIEDDFGVAILEGETLPMTLDIRCA